MDPQRWLAVLPTINAALNALATVLLLVGYAFILHRQVIAHKRCMLAAFATSVAFLACYLLYHWLLHEYTGSSGKRFEGEGPVRTLYFTILISHVILAAIVPVLAPITIYYGLKRRWDKHLRIARITFPIWVYVSVTGVIIYWMLYHRPV